MEKTLSELIFDLRCRCLISEESIRDATSLKPGEFKGIDAMQEGVSLSASELAEKMGLSLSRSSRIIDKMLRDGYLTSETAKDDRRKLVLRVSEKGIELQKKIKEMRQNCDSRISTAMSEEKVKEIKENLIYLIEVL